MSQPTGNAARRTVDITPPDPKPFITVLMICLMPLGVSTGKIDWVEKVAFTPQHYAELLATSNFPELIKYLTITTFSQCTQWLWLINALFFWVFGYVLEKKIKGWRYPTFIFLSMICAWTAVYATAGFNYNKMYIGPSMLMFAMLGGYFAYFPKKPFRPQQWVRPTTEIFRNDKQAPVTERYWVSPWLYVTAFIIYQIALQVGLNFSADFIVNKTHMPFLGTVHGWLIGRMQVQPSAFSPVAALIAIGVGAMFAQVLPKFAMSLKPKRPGGKLQLEVIQHYRELRTLDMTHDQACEGAAKFAAVPIDIAKDWIAKGAAGLKDQTIKWDHE
jgi:membrane associated rhomboid family serine protease